MIRIFLVILSLGISLNSWAGGGTVKRDFLFKQSSFISTGANSIVGDTNPVFKVNELEFDFEAKAGENFWLRTDINYLGDFDFTVVNLIEQAFVEYKAASFLKIYLGKFNAGFGWESHDQAELYQKTHSLAYQFGIPKNLMGAMLDFHITDSLSFKVHVSEGWPLHNHAPSAGHSKAAGAHFFASAASDGDAHSAPLEEDVHVDVNNKKSFGGRLDFSPGNDFRMGAAFIHGPEQAGNIKDDTSLVDFDLTFTGFDKFIFGIDISAGQQQHHDADGLTTKHNWAATYFTMVYKAAKKYSLTMRYENFLDNKNGNLVNFISHHKNELFDTGLFVQGLTLSPHLMIEKNAFIRLDLTAYAADQKYLLGPDGKDSNFQFEAHLEFVARFDISRRKKDFAAADEKSFEDVSSFDNAFE